MPSRYDRDTTELMANARRIALRYGWDVITPLHMILAWTNDPRKREYQVLITLNADPRALHKTALEFADAELKSGDPNFYRELASEVVTNARSCSTAGESIDLAALLFALCDLDYRPYREMLERHGIQAQAVGRELAPDRVFRPRLLKPPAD